MSEEAKRQAAIKLFYQHNRSVTFIAKRLGRSRAWVYKWLDRYSADNPQWFKDESRRPKTTTTTISEATRKSIISARKSLESSPYAQIGAISIQYELRTKEKQVPPIWTINRVLKSAGLVKKKPKYVAKGYEYPKHYLDTQQMDLIGPCYLGAGKRYYGVSVISELTRTAKTYPKPNKSAKCVAQALVDFWKEFGMPDALQMDNELSFRGSNRHPRSLGLVLRLTLSLGIVPVFIPIKEPWRNGIVERYNQTYERHVIKSVKCNSIEDLATASDEFAAFHSRNHRYSSQGSRTPEQMELLYGSNQKLDPEFKLPDKIPLEGGIILFVRFIRSNLRLNILGSEFTLHSDLAYSYITAELIIHSHALVIKRDKQIFHVFHFPMPVDW